MEFLNLQAVEMSRIITIAAHFIFMLTIGFYLMQNLQWFNYSVWRTFTKHTKYKWHFIYLFVPIGLYFAFEYYGFGQYFCFYLAIHIILLSVWYYRLDKKIVWTNRVKRFFITLTIFLTIDFVLEYLFELPQYSSFIALVVALLESKISEAIIMRQYRNLALEKLASMPNLKIIAITASFGKTSMKNFIHALLCKKYHAYATPRSVNTISGIIADINNNLPEEADIYIVEAGARQKGDIDKIAKLLNHHIAVIGEIGEAHLEYFKSIENTKEAKYEILSSERLERVYLFKNNELPEIQGAEIVRFPSEVKNIDSTLKHTKFSLKVGKEFVDFETKILGRFNITNIAVAVAIAQDLGVSTKEIQKSIENLKAVEHRLEKIEVNSKLILDDSFNGNLGGMEETIRLSALHKGGKKIIITPGLVETSVENNTRLALLIDKTFDIAIITGDLNSAILARNITNAQKIILKDKMNLNSILSSFSHSGDLLLFANDAPNYI